MKLIKKHFIFETDEEIKTLIKSLKEMRKCKVSFITSLPGDFALHNGKPSIPDYREGHSRSKLLREDV